jgi:hypothetical protein
MDANVKEQLRRAGISTVEDVPQRDRKRSVGGTEFESLSGLIFRAAPPGFPVSNGMGLLLRVRCTNALITSANPIFFKGFLLHANGNIVPLQDTITPSATDGTETIKILPLYDGVLLSATLSIPNSVLIRDGEVYGGMDVQLGINALSIAPYVSHLASGYITVANSLTYPSIKQNSHTEYVNFLPRIIRQVNQAQQFTFTVPANRRWEFVSLFAALTTGGTAGNRVVAIEFRDPSANTMYRMLDPTLTLPATTTHEYSIGAQAPDGPVAGLAFATNLNFRIGAPAEVLNAGSTIQSNVTGAFAGDQWNVELLVKEWIDPGTAGGGSGGGGGGPQ